MRTKQGNFDSKYPLPSLPRMHLWTFSVTSIYRVHKLTLELEGQARERSCDSSYIRFLWSDREEEEEEAAQVLITRRGLQNERGG